VPIISESPHELPLLRSRRILLRQPVAADVDTRTAIPRDPEEHRMDGGDGAPKIFSREEVEAVLALITNQNLQLGQRFVIAALFQPDGRPIIETDGIYIGFIRLHGIIWAERRARLAVGIFNRQFWSHGYGTEAIRLILDYAFGDLRLHRVSLDVLDINVRAIRSYEKCGFVREGIQRETCFIDGRWHDDIMMGILESEYGA
jgi:RimJ/RimL family protein N-acetyltransferase